MFMLVLTVGTELCKKAFKYAAAISWNNQQKHLKLSVNYHWRI